MMRMPVSVTRLPHGPDGTSRGFDPNSPQYQALSPSSISSSNPDTALDLSREQQARSVLRERYLRSLLSMAGREVRFALYDKVHVVALFGASDIYILNFQVSNLQTPLGVQKEALLRCPDIILYSFEL
ncbi:gem-associated protein 7-like [Latimeria chalumnae]|uniref:gem-associated protein 7-like n=1 Tax=Latimeria chalumnae TaxID=7897 RepID=UPI00313C6D70